MSAQRRSSASNRRTRGASGRKPAGSATIDPTIDVSSTEAVAVAEPTVKSPPTTSQPRMATDRTQRQSRRNERFAGVRRYLNDTRAELRRVTWPDQLTLRNLTLVVIAVSTVMGLLLGGIDFVLLRIFEAL